MIIKTETEGYTFTASIDDTNHAKFNITSEEMRPASVTQSGPRVASSKDLLKLHIAELSDFFNTHSEEDNAYLQSETYFVIEEALGILNDLVVKGVDVRLSNFIKTRCAEEVDTFLVKIEVKCIRDFLDVETQNKLFSSLVDTKSEATSESRQEEIMQEHALSGKFGPKVNLTGTFEPTEEVEKFLSDEEQTLAWLGDVVTHLETIAEEKSFSVKALYHSLSSLLTERGYI